MNMVAKKQYLRAITKRYHKSSKKERSAILDEFCLVCGYSRNYAIRLLNQGHKKKRRRPGRQSIYSNAEFLRALKHIWKASDYKCGKRLKKVIYLYLPHYEKHHGTLAAEIKELLERISPATIDRVLTGERFRSKRGKSLTKPGSILRTHIPLRLNFWDTDRPGFVESDTVAHCGLRLMAPLHYL